MFSYYDALLLVSCFFLHTDSPTIQTIPDKSILVGEKLSLTCRVASANPMPIRYTWTKITGGSFRRTGRVLTIPTIQRSNAGRYRCTVVNTMVPTNGRSQQGSDTEDVVVDVQCMYLVMVADLCHFVFSLFCYKIMIFVVVSPFLLFQHKITK